MLIPFALSPHLPPADVPDLAVQIRVPPHGHRHILHVSNEGGLRRLRRRSDDAPANASLAAWKRRGRKQLNRIITRILCETLHSSGGERAFPDLEIYRISIFCCAYSLSGASSVILQRRYKTPVLTKHL